jgi:cell division protein FtsI/penicillin-binding protein 2
VHRRLRGPLAALAVAVLSAPALAACSRSSAPATPQPGPILRAFVADWSKGAWGSMSRLVLKPPADFATTYEGVTAQLGPAAVTAGVVTVRGSAASAPVQAQVTLHDLGVVVLHGSVRLALHKRAWRVVWSPAAIDRRFRPGDRFVVTPVWGARGAILAAGGATLSGGPSTVTIGVQGSFIKATNTLSAALETAGVTATQAAAAISAATADPSAFVPVITVSEARYEQLKPEIYPVPGTVFRANGATTASPGLAAVIGTLGTPSKAQLKLLGPLYTATSLVGTSGIEETEQSQLAGRPGAVVTLVGPTGSTVATIATFADSAGADVETSIDPAIQSAAENAVSGLGYQAALVAIRASTGQVVAAVNTPLLGNTDLALDGEQPPGSTFKVITSTALIEHGLTPESAASCPPVVNVDGENLHNAGSEAPISSLIGAFTESCNTAFIQLTMANLQDTSLAAAAAQYGVGVTPQLGAPAFGGSVPAATGQTDLAASAIGQAEIVVNPLDLADVAAALDTGVARQPRLVTGTPDDTAPTRTLPATVVTDLHSMMAAVVQTGTAAGTGLPAGTFAKTGTAEYGTGNPLPVDAWLMGWNGDVAFAMCVINAPGEGGPTDGPIVARFLDAINTAG